MSSSSCSRSSDSPDGLLLSGLLSRGLRQVVRPQGLLVPATKELDGAVKAALVVGLRRLDDALVQLSVQRVGGGDEVAHLPLCSR